MKGNFRVVAKQLKASQESACSMEVDIPLSYTQQFTEMRHRQQTCNLPYIFQAWL
jgi:hypothetical protein